MIVGPLEKGIKFRLTPIANGTVLDHLPVGSAPKIISLLGLNVLSGVTMAINTESKGGAMRKDLLFIENMELTPTDLEKIGLVANGSTWNVIRSQKIVQKTIVPLPRRVRGVLKCPNRVCVTNAETLATNFLISNPPLLATCHYCEREIAENEIQKNMQ